VSTAAVKLQSGLGRGLGQGFSGSAIVEETFTERRKAITSSTIEILEGAISRLRRSVRSSIGSEMPVEH